MPITHITAHRLQRTSEASARLSIRDDELIVDEKKEVLLDELKSSFFEEVEGSEQPSFLANKLDFFLKEKFSFLGIRNVHEITSDSVKRLELVLFCNLADLIPHRI